MDNKKYYAPPHIIPYPPDQVPEFIEQLFLDDFITSGETNHVAPACTTVIDSDRKYVHVSNSFCELLGYKSEELVGKRCDEITAPRTCDIPTMFRLFKKLGYLQGMWMLVHRTGERILIRYESWLRPDSNIETHIEVLDHLR